MHFVGEEYYRLNQIFLTVMGLWPFPNSMAKQIYRTFMVATFFFSSITQFAELQNSIRDIDIFLYNMTYALPSVIYIVKYCTYIIYANEVKELLIKMHRNWNVIKDEDEREILRCNALYATWYMTFFYAITLPLMAGYFMSLYLPTFLDFVYPLNESRTQKLPLLADYFFIDKEKYFYPLLTFQAAFIVVGMTMVLSTETMVLMYAAHACGLLEVSRHRLKYAFHVEPSCTSNDEKYTVIHGRIAEALKMHKTAIKFMDYMKSTFIPSYMALLVLGLMTISFNLFRLFQALVAMNDWQELLASFFFVGAQYMYMFFLNYFGQRILDCSFHVFDGMYEAFWYTAPVRAQKFLILILQKTMKGYAMNVSILIMASLETFASLVSMTISYVTVIYSLR